jgi:polysaccharide biosynthesis/export protein
MAVGTSRSEIRGRMSSAGTYWTLLVLTCLAAGARAVAQDTADAAPQASPAKVVAASRENPASGAVSSGASVVPVQPPPGYRVGIDDELIISVWHEPEFSQSVVVRPDGMTTLPLLNDIKVVGLSTEELRALLTEKLKSLVNDPQVTIIVKAIRSLKVFLVGSVGKQGMYPLTSDLTVLQLITEGGGLGPFAKSSSIYILRTINGKQVRIGFNYHKALKGKGADPQLQSGDMVVVP